MRQNLNMHHKITTYSIGHFLSKIEFFLMTSAISKSACNSAQLFLRAKWRQHLECHAVFDVLPSELMKLFSVECVVLNSYFL